MRLKVIFTETATYSAVVEVDEATEDALDEALTNADWSWVGTDSRDYDRAEDLDTGEAVLIDDGSIGGPL